MNTTESAVFAQVARQSQPIDIIAPDRSAWIVRLVSASGAAAAVQG